MSFPFIQAIIIALGILQGLFLIITLVRLRKHGAQSHKILVIFLSIVTLTLMGNMIFVLGRLPEYPHAGLLMDDMFLLYGPLLYLYVGSHLRQPIWMQRRKWIHFIIPGLHITSMIQYILVSPQEFYRIMTEEGVWQYPHDQGLAILSIFFYLTLSWKLYRKSRSEKGLNREVALEVIFWLLLLSALLWSNNFSVDVFGFRAGWPLKRFTNPWTLFPFMTIFLGYYALGKSNFFRVEKEKKRYEGSPLNASQAQAIKKKLEFLMNTDRPFLNAKLTLDELSKLLEVNKKDLSRVINQFYEVNFFDFVNRYRIEEFKKLATPQNIEKHNIMALALDAGFNSKSTFNNAFKRLEGCTPSEFLFRK